MLANYSQSLMVIENDSAVIVEAGREQMFNLITESTILSTWPVSDPGDITTLYHMTQSLEGLPKET